ncbi:MAG: tetratricopeptide repeat protein [bacterium]|nr:tetratricopeptide repeat protein [bacterium]
MQGGTGRTVRVALLAAALAASVAVRPAGAQPTPGSSPASSYADLLHADREGESFVARQLREAKTYPYLDRGNRLLAQGRREEARAELAAYLERDPADVKVRYEYGVLLASLGDAAGAARAMTRVLAQQPGFAPALLYRANARQRLGEQAGALADFRAAARHRGLTPADRTAALDAAANVAVALGRRDVALQVLGDLRDAPADPARDLMSAQLLAEAGRGDEAMAILSRLAAGTATPAQKREALQRLSVLATTSGKLAEARAAGEQALALGPDDPALLRQLAEIARRQGDDAAALAYLQRSARLEPSPDTTRAEVYAAERAGDDARAAELLRGLIAADPVGSPAAVRDRASLAVVEARRGRHAAAADAWLQAFEASQGANPEFLVRAARARAAAKKARWLAREAIGHSNLGQAKLALGEHEVAASELDRACRLADEGGFLDVLADSARALAEVELARANVAEAASRARAAIEAAERSKNAMFVALAHATAMDVFLAAMHTTRSREAFEQARRHKEEAYARLIELGQKNAAESLAKRYGQGSNATVDT